jgi:hypothetical protein
MMTDIMINSAGYFVGDFCPRCGLYSRTTDFYSERGTGAKLANAVENEWIETKRVVTGAMAFVDYNDGVYCANCIKDKYYSDVIWAVKSGILDPLYTNDDIPECIVCGKISKDVYVST